MGFVVIAVSVVLRTVKIIDKTAEYYISAGGNLVQNIGTMLFCTLPPSKFDIDGAVARWSPDGVQCVGAFLRSIWIESSAYHDGECGGDLGVYGLDRDECWMLPLCSSGSYETSISVQCSCCSWSRLWTAGDVCRNIHSALILLLCIGSEYL